MDVATDPGFTNYVPGYQNVSVGSTVTTSFNITGLTCNTDYYYRLRSVGICAGTSANSNVIKVHTPHTLTPAPTVFAATGIQPTQFTVSWAAVPGALNYYLDVYTLGTVLLMYRVP
ncbi:MAG: hypothetical protein IPM96_16715 [Ignavibacteria bacterium]|nr:hypothetical protein [Ignavibacteria bacterium]